MRARSTASCRARVSTTVRWVEPQAGQVGGLGGGAGGRDNAGAGASAGGEARVGSQFLQRVGRRSHQRPEQELLLAAGRLA